jgi:hypothetical protein
MGQTCLSQRATDTALAGGPGSRNYATQSEIALRKNEEKIIDAIVNCALKGDGVAQSICARW